MNCRFESSEVLGGKYRSYRIMESNMENLLAFAAEGYMDVGKLLG